MRRSVIGLAIGTTVSIAIFIPFWFQAAQVYVNVNEGHKSYCVSQPDLQIVPQCAAIKSDFEIFFRGQTLLLALHYISTFFIIGRFFLVGSLTSIIGFLILLLPVTLGFFIGLFLELIIIKDYP